MTSPVIEAVRQHNEKEKLAVLYEAFARQTNLVIGLLAAWDKSGHEFLACLDELEMDVRWTTVKIPAESQPVLETLEGAGI